MTELRGDAVNHPVHYNVHPSGVEAIELCEHMSFCSGNALKYVWRAGLKKDRREDLKKAAWYLRRQITHDARYGVRLLNFLREVVFALKGAREYFRNHERVTDVMQDVLRDSDLREPDLLGTVLRALATGDAPGALAAVMEELAAMGPE